MKCWWGLVSLLINVGLSLVFCGSVFGNDLEQEYVTTTPVMVDGVLYVASTSYPGHRGHLRAIDVLALFPVTLWDAAEEMPLAGRGLSPGALASGDPPTVIQVENLYRSIFTNVDGETLPFTAAMAERLQFSLDVPTSVAAEVLLHSVRGRRGCSFEQAAGLLEDDPPLWSLSKSSPVLIDRSPLNLKAKERDRILYAGGEDGMLHAFFVSSLDADTGNYQIDHPDGGKELWAYLPGSFLPYLKEQPLEDDFKPLAVHLDGSPIVRDLFIDLDGDGHRRWHTLLVATGTRVQSKQSNLFVLEVTDPYQPQLLWEQMLPGDGVGRTRGVTFGACTADSVSDTCLYLATDRSLADHSAGIHALAISLETGRQLWQFSAPYEVACMVSEATPAVPALMDLDGDDQNDALIFGDMLGQLWLLNLRDGSAYGDGPIFVVPGGAAEPIGAGVTVHGRQVFFGTGGVEGSSDTYQYALYSVEVFPEGGQLSWRYPLETGEKVWQAPVLDGSGNLVFATSRDYLSLNSSPVQPTSGRVVSLDAKGEETSSRNLDAAVLGQVVTAPGVVVAVTLTGEVIQFGSASRLNGPEGPSGSVKILSWRQR